MRKIVKRMVCIFAVLLVLAYVAACNILVDVALIPEKMKQTQAFEEVTEESYAALVQTDDIQQNRAKSIEKTNEWLQSVAWEEWSVTTEDGYDLVGTAFFQQAAGSRWVLILHGYTGWKEEMYPTAYEYFQKGYQVLVPDMRCSGKSEGNFIGMGWLDRKDNLLWLSEIMKKDADAEIVIHGQSMGASAGLMMTGEKLPGNVKAVVADSAYTDAYEMFKKQMKDWFRLPAFPLLDGANLMLQLRGGYDLKKASALEAVKNCKIPVLLIHGEEDVFVPSKMTEKLYEAVDSEKELLVMPGAGHAQAPDKDPELFYGTVFSFLEKYGL